MSSRPGRKDRGERKPTMVRVPVEHYQTYVDAAKAAGMDLGNYIARQMALIHGLPLDVYPHLQAHDGEDGPPLAEAS